MSKSVKQISFLACLFLVVLRVSIGWQFLYEGLWKLKTQKTSQTWSAEGYLKNARGPFREKFRGMVDDPDGLDKLDYDKVVASWDDWYTRFKAFYPDLSDVQKRQIEALMDGPKEFTEALPALPKGVDVTKFKSAYKLPKESYLRYDAKEKRLATNLHIVPKERDELLKMVTIPPAPPKEQKKPEEKKPDDADKEKTDKDQEEPKDGKPEEKPAEEPVVDKAQVELAKKYQAAIQKLYERTSKLSLKERLQVLLKEDPERVGVIQEAYEGTVDHKRPGEIQIYKHLLDRYERNLTNAKVGFQQDHLAKQWQEIQEKRASLVGPVDALTSELQSAAYKTLNLEQSARGQIPATETKVSKVNHETIWLLIILGAGLMAGLFSRLSALGAAVMLLLFYLPMPPWPGVPEAPGPEHSLFVNKNLIECIACVALATMPSGRWMGLDSLIHRFILRRHND